MSYTPDQEKFKRLHEIVEMVKTMNTFVENSINEERTKCISVEDFVALKDAAPDCVARIFLLDTIRQMQKQGDE